MVGCKKLILSHCYIINVCSWSWTTLYITAYYQGLSERAVNKLGIAARQVPIPHV